MRFTVHRPVHTFHVVRLDRDLAEPLVHTGLAPRRPAVRPGEKVRHRLGEVPQRLLLHGLRTCRQPAVLGANCGQLSGLLVVPRRAPAALPVLLLLDSQIPHIPSVAAMLAQRRRLFRGRKQPIPRRSATISATTDKSPKGGAAFPPPANARGFHAATPQ